MGFWSSFVKEIKFRLRTVAGCSNSLNGRWLLASGRWLFETEDKTRRYGLIRPFDDNFSGSARILNFEF